MLVYGSVRCSMADSGGSAYVDVKTDSSTPPTTIVQTTGIKGFTIAGEGEDSVSLVFSFQIVVQPDDYYRVDSTTTGLGVVALDPTEKWNEVDF